MAPSSGFDFPTSFSLYKDTLPSTAYKDRILSFMRGWETGSCIAFPCTQNIMRLDLTTAGRVPVAAWDGEWDSSIFLGASMEYVLGVWGISKRDDEVDVAPRWYIPDRCYDG